jgi:oligo-1,6-glucosidase
MNREVLSKYDIMTVGETAGVTVEEAEKYGGLDSRELSMVFQFEHVGLVNENGSKWSDKKIDLRELKQIMKKWQNALEGKAWNSLYWENHDQPRSVSRFCDDMTYWDKAAKTLAVCLHMMQGTPYIYQGQEIGMTNTVFTGPEDFRDIEAINAYREFTEEKGVPKEIMLRHIAKEGRDNARTPMQWSADDEAGFTTGEPWISVNPNYKDINAQKQLGDPNSVFAAYQTMIRLRRELDVVTDGRFVLLDEESGRNFSYIRESEHEKLLVACNFCGSTINLAMPDDMCGGDIIYHNYETPPIIDTPTISLRPWETAIVYRHI